MMPSIKPQSPGTDSAGERPTPDTAPVADSLPVRSLLLHDRRGPVLVLHDARRLLDIGLLRTHLQRLLEPAPQNILNQYFPQCQASHPPALPGQTRMPVVLGTELFTDQALDLPTERADVPLHVNGSELRQFYDGARYYAFSLEVEPMPTAEGPDDTVEQQNALRLRDRVRRIHQLPAMPEISHRILQLRIDPRARAGDLADLVENDPSLAAQVIRRACSSLYGYRGRIDSVRDAIVRVLGFDQVMQLALGIAIGRSFRVPRDGDTGLHNLWRRSIYCSVLVSCLARRMPLEQRPVPGLASLAGLFHNFGRLLLGHAFPSEFLTLQRLLAANRHLPVAVVERHLLGVEDTDLGGWLMQAWRLPEEVTTAVRRHRYPAYRGPHRDYAALVCLANRLLKPHGLGDADDAALPQDLLDILGLDLDTVWEALDEALSDVEGLDRLSRQLGG